MTTKYKNWIEYTKTNEKLNIPPLTNNQSEFAELILNNEQLSKKISRFRKP